MNYVVKQNVGLKSYLLNIKITKNLINNSYYTITNIKLSTKIQNLQKTIFYNKNMESKNLRPFKKGYDERRQIGRKLGSKNISTIVNELLAKDLDDFASEKIKKLISKYNSRTVRDAILAKTIELSLQGDLKASQWLFSYLDLDEAKQSPQSFFNQKELKIKIIEPSR